MQSQGSVLWCLAALGWPSAQLKSVMVVPSSHSHFSLSPFQ